MKSRKRIKAVLVTNVPAPYRVPMLRHLANESDIDLEVIYCAQPHIDTSLDEAAHGFKIHFLTGRYVAMQKRFLHWDLSVVRLLERIQPDVVITTGFIPTFLYAFAWSVYRGRQHVALTDGTAQSESRLTAIHRWVRRFVFKRTSAFVGASQGSLALFRSFDVPNSRQHIAQLCVDNARFHLPQKPDAADFLFSGRFVEHKRPIFAMQVAYRVAEILGRKTTIDFLGKGPMEQELQHYAASISDRVEVRFRGYASQSELPDRFAAARIFLFPSEWDPWGLVANEACAAGLPVIVSPHAGVAGELVLDEVNGFVVPLEVEAWAARASSLLQDESLYNRLSRSGRERVAAFNFDFAAQGLADAIRQADSSASTEQERSVCIIQAVAKQYRQPFFDGLYQRLKQDGVRLKVMYSDANAMEALRRDAIDLPVEYGHKVPAYWFMNWHVLYQPVIRQAMASDLVISDQASKHVVNYFLMALSAVGIVRFAYWGHGRNWQERRATFSERLKRMLLPHVDWWFVYTRRVGNYVVESGFSEKRLTVVNNSVDVSELRNRVSELDAKALCELRLQKGIPPDAKVGLFCGSMHQDKKLEFLLQAAHELHVRMPSFHLILVGNGPRESLAREAAAQHPWIHYVERAVGQEKSNYFAIADAFLCPGLVGLAVLDAFAAGLPLFTTNIPTHSPEIDYLQSGFNGLMTERDPARYAECVARCLCNPWELERLSKNARNTAQNYSMDAMVNNYAQGILACLNQS